MFLTISSLFLTQQLHWSVWVFECRDPSFPHTKIVWMSPALPVPEKKCQTFKVFSVRPPYISLVFWKFKNFKTIFSYIITFVSQPGERCLVWKFDSLILAFIFPGGVFCLQSCFYPRWLNLQLGRGWGWGWGEGWR